MLVNIWFLKVCWGFKTSKISGRDAQQLKHLLLSRGSSSVPSTQTVTYNHLELQFQGIQCPFLLSVGTRHIHDINAHIQAKCSYI